MIREEAVQLGDELANLVGVFLDDVPNKDQAAAILDNAFGLVKEGMDFAGIPKEERIKAVLVALSYAGNKVAQAAVKFSDEA